MKASVYHFERALELARQHSLKPEGIQCLTWLGNHAFLKNHRKKADSLYHTALGEARLIDYTDGIANSYFGLYSLEEDREQRMRYLITIDSLYENTGRSSPVLANTLGHMGKLYIELDNLGMARYYLEKSVMEARKNHYEPGIVYNQAILGDLALRENRFEEAHAHFQELLDIATRRNDTLNMAFSLLDLGRYYLATGEFPLAVTRLQRALKFYTQLKDSVSITSANLWLAKSYIGMGNLTRAKSYLEYARTHPRFITERDYAEQVLETAISFEEHSGNYQQAYSLQKTLDSIRKAAIEQQNSQAFMDLEQQYNASKKEKEIALLKSEKDLADQQKRNQRNLLLGGIGLTSLAGIFLFLLLRNRQKTNQRLKELDRLKSNFFANISHEFRTPLTLITSPLEERLAHEALKGKERAEMELMYRNARRLEDLVTQLMDLSKLESGKYHLQVRHGLPEHILQTMVESFRYLAKQHKLQFQVGIQALGSGWFDRDLLEKVVSNILSNAIKYTPKDGLVNFMAERRENHLFLLFENSCPPLKEQELNQIFDRFYQADEHAEGAGIGLALVKELIRLARGTISVGQQNSVLRFEISMPINEAAFPANEKAMPSGDGREFEILATTATEGLAGRPNPGKLVTDLEDKEILLVVEDHRDLRAYIAEMFEKEYLVLQAENGRHGLQQAIEHVPDLIISDIMMPEMDGLTLCSQIKKDERTSHIPVLLLTARAEEEAEYVGLATGADDYVTKPFKRRLLETRVRNLITTRKQLRERYSQEIILKPRDMSITPVDEQFLNKVQEILNQRLVEPTFNTTEFSEALGMSRMQLHRKLKALTGLSTSGFIRSQRLAQALALLKNGGVRISEIGYRVGFNDPSYFSKCFKAAYGETPSAYLSNIPPG